MGAYYTDDHVTLHHGDAASTLATLPDASVDCIVTSPPYFGLRDYGVDGQIGAEPTPAEFVEALVAVFREARRVLADDGTLWLNLGDSYSGPTGPPSDQQINARRDGTRDQKAALMGDRGRRRKSAMPAKNLLGIPWRVAFALQDDGWILRSDIIWCISGGAWIYARTAKGDMPVMVKDLVRLDPSTVQLWNGERWTRVLGWGPSTDTSERIEVVLRSGERIGATGGHQWPTQRGLVRTADLHLGDVIESCTIPEPANASMPGYLTDDVLWLCGLYLAEGSRSGTTMQLSLHADEISWVSRIEAAAGHLGGTVAHTVDGNKLAVRMWGSTLSAAVETFIGGRAAKDKHLRNAAWRLPNDALRQVVHGYLDGDGSYDPASDRIRLGFTRNYALERDLRTLAARLDATITLRPMVAKFDGREFPAFRGEWRWTRSGHHNEKDRGEVIELRSSRARKFWDIAVEDEPHLFALASGVLTHNCKPNAMPESVTDRLSGRHEHVFMFSKQRSYWFDLDAVREPAITADRTGDRASYERPNGLDPQWTRATSGRRGHAGLPLNDAGRNPGDVWSIPTTPFSAAHFATMPPALAERCILAGCRPGGVVLDPFSGSGTTGMAAAKHGRRYVGIELNEEYLALSLRTRLAQGVLDFGGAA